MVTSNLHDRCQAEGREELLSEWHPTKNLPLTANDVGACSEKRVWWICGVCGWEWKAQICERFGRRNRKPSGCPKCAKRPKVTLREWCIENNRQDLLEQFDFEKTSFTPDEVSAHSSKTAHWHHFDEESGMVHEWTAIIGSRTKPTKTGCPYCAGVRTYSGYNDLATRRPDLIPYWDFTQNTVDPSTIPLGYAAKVFWICPECGDRWESTVANVSARSHPCLQCLKNKRYAARTTVITGVNDLATTHPTAIDIWHPIKNGDLKPEDVTANSDKEVWWCYKNSVTDRWIEWKDPISYRANHLPSTRLGNLRIRLRKDASDLATTHAFLAEEWSKKNIKSSSQVMATSDHEGWWSCGCCGHEWRRGAVARAYGSFCPQCDKQLSAGAVAAYRRIISQLDARLESTPFGPGIKARLPFDPFDEKTRDPDRYVIHLAIVGLFDGWETICLSDYQPHPDHLLIVDSAITSSKLIEIKYGVRMNEVRLKLSEIGAIVFDESCLEHTDLIVDTIFSKLRE